MGWFTLLLFGGETGALNVKFEVFPDYVMYFIWA